MTTDRLTRVAAVGLTLLLAACSGGADDTVPESTEASDEHRPGSTGQPGRGANDADSPSSGVTPADSTAIGGVAAPEARDVPPEFETFEQLEQYLAAAADVPLADADSAVPPHDLEGPAGAPGFTRYVFREVNGEVIPSLVEGPLGNQVRCQDPALPCSFNDLVALAESGDPIPAELELTGTELDRLVAELETARDVIEQYADVDRACRDGFVSDRTQTPNMGSHFFDLARIADGGEFDPAEPEILLYALAGDVDPGGQLGYCENGVWNGSEMEITGVSYYLPRDQAGDEHPEGFTGGFDNWHLHYNLCRGAGADAILTATDCIAAGGSHSNAAAWMIHAWANPSRDNALGVFSMWNPSIWPIADPAAVAEARVEQVHEPAGAKTLPISDFRFGNVTLDIGQEVVFANADSVPHTVTAETAGTGAPTFDSGVLAPSQSYSLTFDSPGAHAYFCVLHPGMQGTIVVS